MAMLAGCVLRTTGLVEDREGRLRLVTVDGREFRLVLVGDSRPIAHLQGHFVEVEGPRRGRTLVVRDWRVPTGLHGLQAWVGRLEAWGAQLGLQDRNTGAFYLLDPTTWELLRPFLGLPVLVEGYVEGAHRVRVMYFRVLADEPLPARVPPEPT